MKIGYIGLGAMGSSLAGQMIGKLELSVWDLNRQAIDSLAQLGALPAASPAALARDCDALLYCLPRSTEVEASLFGPAGIARLLRPGQVVIDQTSGVPGQTAAIAERLRAQGVFMVDAPISGGVAMARQGKATIMCSGPDDAWSVAEPIIRHISEKVFRCSDRVGDAQAMKLINNALGSGYRTATLELAAAGCKLGLPLDAISARLQSGSARNVTARTMLPARLEGRSYTDFALGLMVKDMTETILLAQSVAAPMPLSTACRGLLMAGMNMIGPQARLEQIFEIIERLSGAALVAGPGSDLDAPAADAMLRALEDALTACNELCVHECVTLGLRHGLTLEAMRDILNAGSAWSAASEAILGALAEGRTPVSSLTLAAARDALRLIVNAASRQHVPLWLPNIVLAEIEGAIGTFGEAANLSVFQSIDAHRAGMA